MPARIHNACFLLLLNAFFLGCSGQQPYGTDQLQLIKTIPLPNVKGRIDHMDINLRDQVVYVAALGNNTVEAVDLRSGHLIGSIKGLDEPQGIGYIPQHEEIFIANGGNGDCYFYDAHSFEKKATIHLSSDADDVRYDSSKRTIYVGFGNGGIAIIDADSHRQTAEVKLPAHPESFQIDHVLNLLYVNLPDANMVGVVDLKALSLMNKWVRSAPTANFPMTLDAVKHRVIIGYRNPPKLLVLDGKIGKEISSNTIGADTDDLYYDGESGQIIISCGAGYINIFREKNGDGYEQIANIPSSNGARTSLLIPQLKLFVVAARAASGNTAKLLIYKTVQ